MFVSVVIYAECARENGEGRTRVLPLVLFLFACAYAILLDLCLLANVPLHI